MLKRTITGAVYVAIILLCFLLRGLDYRLFNVLVTAFSGLGTFEVARAIKDYLYKGNLTLSVIFGVLFVPIFCVFQYFTSFSGAYACLIFIAVALSYQAILSAVKEKNVNGRNLAKTLRAFIVNALPFVYPALLLLTTMLANELPSGLICLILIFAVSPCADTFAYLVGMTYNKIRKGKAKKMCPKLSPKKTWAGAIGGIVGGILGSIAVYALADVSVLSATAKISPIIICVICGAIGSAVTEIGDLFESYIKRKVGIKDMGKILPGHGGIMDRIDGMSFASAFIYLIFVLLA